MHVKRFKINHSLPQNFMKLFIDTQGTNYSSNDYFDLFKNIWVNIGCGFTVRKAPGIPRERLNE